jgi:hypothetical protein
MLYRTTPDTRDLCKVSLQLNTLNLNKQVQNNACLGNRDLFELQFREIEQIYKICAENFQDSIQPVLSCSDKARKKIEDSTNDYFRTSEQGLQIVSNLSTQIMNGQLSPDEMDNVVNSLKETNKSYQTFNENQTTQFQGNMDLVMKTEDHDLKIAKIMHKQFLKQKNQEPAHNMEVWAQEREDITAQHAHDETMLEIDIEPEINEMGQNNKRKADFEAHRDRQQVLHFTDKSKKRKVVANFDKNVINGFVPFKHR